MHHQVAWLNGILEDNPSRLASHKAYLGLTGLPGIGTWIQRHGYIPSEAYPYWSSAYRGFERPFRDLTADDVTDRARERMRRLAEEITTSSRRTPLLKITGWPRVAFLAEIFPEAKFVNVVRDGRAVAASLMAVDFWEGWRGPSTWRFGELPERYQDEWERHDQSFVALAGIAWKLMIDAMEVSLQEIPDDRVLRLRYEDICSDQIPEYRRTVEFAGLDWTSRFENQVSKFAVESQNGSWRRAFTEQQQAQLNEILVDHLRGFGYLEPESNTVIAGI